MARSTTSGIISPQELVRGRPPNLPGQARAAESGEQLAQQIGKLLAAFA
ncbi:hypothetical protein OHB01_29375 [Microbispora hainanensis]|nr:hypothetical protein [Microbispora hainanensis]